MDPKSALGGPKPISRTRGSLLKNWNFTSNQCIYFSILLDWRSHLAKTLFIFHKYLKYIKSALFIENYLRFMENCIRSPYEKLKSLKSGFIENSNFENNWDLWGRVNGILFTPENSTSGWHFTDAGVTVLRSKWSATLADCSHLSVGAEWIYFLSICDGGRAHIT